MSAETPEKIWLNLSEWDSLENPLAPLSSQEKDSILELASVVDNKPFPMELTRANPLQPRVSTEREVTKPSSSDVRALGSFTKLAEGIEQIDSSQQFYAWYSQLEWELLQEEDSAYRLYLGQLENYQRSYQEFLDQVEETLGKLHLLTSQHDTVSHKTNSLREACEQMLADQTKLNVLADEVEHRLLYFSDTGKIAHLLGSPTLSIHGESFVKILDRLDECIGYLQEHSQFRESAVHLTKYRTCLNQALSLVRSWVSQALESSAQQAKTQQAPVQTTSQGLDSVAYTLLYGKFRVHAEKMKTLMTDIEGRLHRGPEYEQLIADCHSWYFNVRGGLLRPSVLAALKDLNAAHPRDHCALTRCACAFLLRVCHDEWQLYHQFFGQATAALHNYLDELCSVLYDTLRPHIIHLNHLETLAELCFILRVEMVEEHVAGNPEELSSFDRVVRQLLADAQERLVYRAHVYVQTDIVGYKPASGDLAYPEKLIMIQNISESLQQQQQGLDMNRPDSRASVTSQDVVRSHTGNSPADLHGMWYPPLRRALLCLSKLYRSVDRSTFQGLSQEVLAAACASLANAAFLILSSKTPLDAHLFHIKHLLILREQIAPFQVDFAVKEMSLDFSTVKNAALGLFQNRNRIFSLSANNSLLEFLLEGAPQVREHLRDSRRLADRQLKTTCEAFIDYCGDFLIGPVRVLLSKMDACAKQPDFSSSVLKSQPFGQPPAVADAVSEAQKLLRLHLPAVQKSLQLYLANRETEFILFRPVKNLIVSSFSQLQQHLSNYNEEEQALIACPTAEQVSVLLSALLLRTADSPVSDK